MSEGTPQDPYAGRPSESPYGADDGYAAPPPTQAYPQYGYPQQGYARQGSPQQQGYPQQGNPQQQGYPHQQSYEYGFPQQQGYPPPAYGYPPAGYPPPYPYGYPPPYAAGPVRPGSTTTASILGYIAAGLLIFAGVVLWSGANIANDIGDAVNEDTGSITTELVLDGIANMVAAGLLLAGSVMLSGRKLLGRNLYCIGAAIVIVLSIYWIARFESYGGTIFFALIFAALAIVGVSMALTRASRQWLAGAADATRV